MVQAGFRKFQREKWRMQLFVLQRENEINTSDTFTKPNWFGLDSDGAHKVHKYTSSHSNISLYCGFKELKA